MSGPLLEAMEHDMRVDDVIRKTVVYIGDANNKPFVPHGTGFVGVTADDGFKYQCVVTARHVIDGFDGPYIHLRVNDHNGKARIIEAPREVWRPHPSGDIDLVACISNIPKDQFDVRHIDLEGDMVFRDYKNPDAIFGLGDEVIVAGMYVARKGEAKNIPIIRTGTIAAMPEEKIRTLYGSHESYLVETRSIDGLSGSPVFVTSSFFGIARGRIQPTPTLHFNFLGVLLGTDEVMNQRDFVSADDPAEMEVERARTMLNTGIGIVVPGDFVVETVKHPETLRAIRERRIEVGK